MLSVLAVTRVIITALQKLTHLTEQEYLAFELNADVRHEYIDGQLYAMAGASERHNRIAGNVFFHPRAATSGGHCGVFISDMKLKIAWHKAYYYPDVMLVCNALDNREYYKQQPCFIAEVLSPVQLILTVVKNYWPIKKSPACAITCWSVPIKYRSNILYSMPKTNGKLHC